MVEIQFAEKLGGSSKKADVVLVPPAPKAQTPQLSDSCFFDDGKRHIDIVLAFQPNIKAKSSSARKKELIKEKYRESFKKRLEANGLDLECEDLKASQDGKTCFIKVHVPWEFMARNAERLGVKVPLTKNDLPKETSLTEKLLSCFGRYKNPFRLPEVENAESMDWFSMTFDRRRLECYRIEDEETFWKRSQRIRLVDHEVKLTAIPRINPNDISANELESFEKTIDASGTEGVGGENKKNVKEEQEEEEEGDMEGDFGLESDMVTFHWLLKQKVFTCSFALHDCDLDESGEHYKEYNNTGRPLPMRLFLKHTWGKWARWKKYQPLDYVYEYFGSEIGLYFAWLGFYTKFLTVLALCSILCLFYGFYSAGKPFVKDICDEDGLGDTIMCRKCPTPGCEFTLLNKDCTFALFASIFDNNATPFFAFITSVWAICFLEFWKRYQASLAAKWGTDDAEEGEVMLRPDYQYGVKTKRFNPVTLTEETYLPTSEKVRRVGVSIAVTGCLVVVLLVLVIMIIAYRSVGLFIWYRIAHDNELAMMVGGPSMLTSMTAAILNAFIIILMSAIFPRVATTLTKFEYPRTQEEFDQSYIYKVILFEFINYYGMVLYLAFFKGKFSDTPIKGGKLDTSCPYSGCMTDVCVQLLIVMTGKQVLQNFKEVGKPMVKNWLRRRAIKTDIDTEENPFSQWEKDFILEPVETPIAFDDYLEMIIQYGFLTMFAPAFPLSAFFALLNNIFEIRIDAGKYLSECRLPVPAQVKTIGVWGEILTSISRVSVVINAFIIAFTSEFIDKFVHYIQTGSFEDNYLNSTLTAFQTKDYISNNDMGFTLEDMQYSKQMNKTVETCYFRSHYDPQNGYSRTTQWLETDRDQVLK